MGKKTRRDQYKRQKATDESWLIPYADILTLLLALFVVLFAMSSVDAEKFEELSRSLSSAFSGGTGVMEYPNPNQAIVNDLASKDKEELSNNSLMEFEELRALQAAIESYTEKENLHNRLTTNLSGEGLKITILDDALFDSGSADVKESARNMGREIANFLVSDPPRNVEISGHTDNRPIHNAQFQSNWHLSVMRAVNFMQVLLENDELDPSFLSAKGYGEFQPIETNETRDGRAKNRRVEVLILPNTELVQD